MVTLSGLLMVPFNFAVVCVISDAASVVTVGSLRGAASAVVKVELKDYPDISATVKAYLSHTARFVLPRSSRSLTAMMGSGSVQVSPS